MAIVFQRRLAIPLRAIAFFMLALTDHALDLERMDDDGGWQTPRPA